MHLNSKQNPKKIHEISFSIEIIGSVGDKRYICKFRYKLSRRYHGFELKDMSCLTSSECFVLEMVIDNLNHNPQTIKQVIEELMKRRKDTKKVDKLADIEDGLKNGFNKRPTGYYQDNLQLNNETLPVYEKMSDKGYHRSQNK